jgi:hypothetical protein
VPSVLYSPHPTRSITFSSNSISPSAIVSRQLLLWEGNRPLQSQLTSCLVSTAEMRDNSYDDPTCSSRHASFRLHGMRHIVKLGGTHNRDGNGVERNNVKNRTAR